jgi:uncharacterized repeat protein (TIGR04138 family)
LLSATVERARLHPWEEVGVEDRAYAEPAYAFLLEALAEVRQELARAGHVSGAELLAGIARLAAERYGPLAALVFREWGIASSRDFGNMVYELIERGVLYQRDEDSIEDFMGGAPYAEIFEVHYFQGGRP